MPAECFSIRSRLLSLCLWLPVRFVLCSFYCNKLFINEYLVRITLALCVFVQKTTMIMATKKTMTVTVWRRRRRWLCVCCGPRVNALFVCDRRRDEGSPPDKLRGLHYCINYTVSDSIGIISTSHRWLVLVVCVLVRFDLLRLRPLF